jgi:hypothetical protein
MGLWVGATQQSFLIGLIGIGGALALMISGGASPDKNSFRMAPELWRYWGYSGAFFSLLFYLLEYFPNHMSMRLEVNHPLYALAWIGGAEAINCIVHLVKGELDSRQKRLSCFFLVLSLVAIVLLPCLILFGPNDWHMIHDPVMHRVHKNIAEFKPPMVVGYSSGMKLLLVNFGLFPVYIFIAVFLTVKNIISRYHKAILIFTIVPTLILMITYFFQTRWQGFAAIGLVMLSLISSLAFQTNSSLNKYGYMGSAIVLVLLLIPGNYLFFLDTYCGTRIKRINSRLHPLVYAFLAREVAINFFERTATKDVRIMSNSSFSPYLAYYGVGRGVGSLYWENHDGIRDWAGFFADLGEENAKEIARRRGLTHIILKVSTDGMARRSTWALYGTTSDEVTKKTFAYRLISNHKLLPSWLEPFPMFYSPHSRKNGNILIRIKPDDVDNVTD